MIDAACTVEETMERMFCLPLVFEFRRPVSLTLLAEQTGYLAFRDTIGCARLQAAIRQRQGLIEAWLRYSKEKDEDWGWFMEGPDCGQYLVGTRTYSIDGPWHHTDANKACAQFIKGEFESLLGMGPGAFGLLRNRAG